MSELEQAILRRLCIVGLVATYMPGRSSGQLWHVVGDRRTNLRGSHRVEGVGSTFAEALSDLVTDCTESDAHLESLVEEGDKVQP